MVCQDLLLKLGTHWSSQARVLWQQLEWRIEMVRKLFRTHGRHRPDELITALLALSPLELVQNLVKLFARASFASQKEACQTPSKYAPISTATRNNPRIADWFLTAARSCKRTAPSPLSISALTEHIRWDISRWELSRPRTDSEISNDVRALYARLVARA